MIHLGSESNREVFDMMLTRYACYLIAQNGDSQKEEVAFVQTYFAIQMRKFEIIQQRLLESERVSARKKLADMEKELSGIIYEQIGSDKNFRHIEQRVTQRYAKAVALLSSDVGEKTSSLFDTAK